MKNTVGLELFQIDMDNDSRYFLIEKDTSSSIMRRCGACARDCINGELCLRKAFQIFYIRICCA